MTLQADEVFPPLCPKCGGQMCLIPFNSERYPSTAAGRFQSFRLSISRDTGILPWANWARCLSRRLRS